MARGWACWTRSDGRGDSPPACAIRVLRLSGWDQSVDTNQTLAQSGFAYRPTNSRASVAAVSDIVISIITEDHGVRQIFTGSQRFSRRRR